MPEKIKEITGDVKEKFFLFILVISMLVIVNMISVLLMASNSSVSKLYAENALKPSYNSLLKIYEPEVNYSQEINKEDSKVDEKSDTISYSVTSSKSSKKKSSKNDECGNGCRDDYYSSNYCSDDNIVRDLHDFDCIRGGCTENTSKEIVEDCGEDYCGAWENYCKENNVYRSRTCYDSGCEQGACFKRGFITEELVKNCSDSCINGECSEERNFNNLVIVQMDDASAWWNVEITNALIEAFHSANIELVIEVAPANLNNDTIFLNYVKNWDSYSNVEIAQGFYVGQGFFPPQNNLSYDETRQNLQLGKGEFLQAGITQPLTYIPAWAYGTTDTLDALRDEGFHTELDYAVAPEIRNGINKLPLTIDSGFEIISLENGSLRNESEIKSAIDLMIAEKGFANLAFHHQGFGEGSPDTEKINEMINILTSLKNQEYNFITAEGYFQHINIVKDINN